jgi:hypothetical protein
VSGPPVPAKEAGEYRAWAQAWVRRLDELAQPLALAQH